jgi:FG-GAP-like repeat/FG-GAP repeat
VLKGGVLGDVTGDGKPDLLAIAPNGTLLLYPNTGATGTNTFGAATQVGTGWTGYTIAAVTDLYGSGRAGILAIAPNGTLAYYPNTGATGTNTFGAATQVGSGWTGWTVDSADINGDGKPDLLAVNPAGNLYMYPNTGATGTNTFGPATQVGSGWTGWQALDTGSLSGAPGADILAIDPTGTMYQFPNTGATGTNTFGPATKIGTGWTGYTIN